MPGDISYSLWHRCRGVIEKQLKSLISNSGKSLNALAKEAAVDYATLHRFVNDGRRVQITFVESLCAYFGLELGCTDRQVKSYLREVATDFLRQSGREFKCPNGGVDTEKLQTHLESLDHIVCKTDDRIQNLAAARFNDLNSTKRSELIRDAVGMVSFSDSMYQANQKWLHKLDQAIPELRNAYDGMSTAQRKTLKRYLAQIVEAQSLQRLLSGPHEFALSTSVGHEEYDEEGMPVDGHWVEIKPEVMLAAVEAWDKGDEFTPKSFRQFC